MDRTATQSYYEIDFDLESKLPKSIKKTVLTGVRGGGFGDKNKRAFGNEEHVAFHFTYSLGAFGEVESFTIPAPARKLLR